MKYEITIIKKTPKETIFKANIDGIWTICKVVKGDQCYILVDDAFARINGYDSLKDFMVKQPGFKKQYDMSQKDEKGNLWLYVDMQSGSFLAFKKTMIN